MCPLLHSTTATEMTTIFALDCSQYAFTQQPEGDIEKDKSEHTTSPLKPLLA